MKHSLLRVLCALFLLLACLSCSSDKSIHKVYRLGTGGTGGNYYALGQNLDAMARKKADFGFEVRSTAGSAANLRLISNGFLDMALAQSDMIKDAWDGKKPFSEPLSGFHVGTTLYTESCQLIVAKDAGIQTLKDCAGKRLSIGEDDSGVQKTVRLLLNTEGIPVDTLVVHRLSFADAAKALEEGRIDGFFVIAGTPTKAIAELAAKKPVELIGFSETTINSLVTLNPEYKPSTIAANTYVGQTKPVVTLGVQAVLIIHDMVPEAVEKTVLTMLQENGSALQKLSFGAPAAPKKEQGMPVIFVNMYLTLALSVCVLYLGTFMRRKIRFLETFCIPAPVIGGLIFAIVSCILYTKGIAEFKFDETLRNVCMIMFFTSVGFQANFKVLKSGGVALGIFLLCVVGLIIAQNTLAIVLAKVLGVSSFIGLCTGSIPMVGGHGTAGAFGMVLEDLGLDSALTLCTASATFGLVIGSLMGGPLARRLILKHDLLKTAVQTDDSVLVEDELKHRRKASLYAPAAYQLAIAMGLGTICSQFLSQTGMTFPAYIGAMIVAAIMRNLGEFSGKFTIHMGEINDLGGISLFLFLGIAMITLKLWQLSSLALPLIVLLSAQAVLMGLFAYYVIFRCMGRDYDAAVLVAGSCGFGMGATPNAMANMQALTEKFAPSIKAYILVPIVGSMFADFFNSLIITFFINFV